VPLVSIIMANYRNGPYLEQALRTALLQTHGEIEVVISDDASDDGSLDIARTWCARDPRVRLIESRTRTGPGATRNRALTAACGDWLAIMDGDDLMHPDRIARLLRAAARLSADAVADDLIHFSENPDAAGRTLLQPLALAKPMRVTPTLLVASSIHEGRCPPLGYLKPLIRRTVLGGRRYNETLTIGEDHDLYLRLLTGGARFFALPEALYLYRRHASSSSHRFTVAALESMLRADAAALAGDGHGPAFGAEMAARRRMLERWLSFMHLVEEVQGRRPLAAASRLAQEPWLAGELLRSVRERLARTRARRGLERKEPLLLALGAKGKPTPKEFESAAWLAVPDPEADGGPEAAELWARLSLDAARQALHLVVADDAGLSAAWRVPAAARLTVVERDAPYALPLPPCAEPVRPDSLRRSPAA
jgi:succinoglycan biosynthesis protein ExoO